MSKRSPRLHWSQKRRDQLADDLDLLLEDLCRNGGFCNWLSGESLLAEHNPINASDFATAVLYAEGLKARHSPFRPYIEKAFIARYGKETSSESYDATIPVILSDFPEPSED